MSLKPFNTQTAPPDGDGWGRTITALLGSQPKAADRPRVCDILDKASALQGLNNQEVASLLAVEDPALWAAMFDAARRVKEEIYGSRLVLFAPLYISSECANECLYCAFRRGNTTLARRTLTLDEIGAEAEAIIRQGHKRILLVAGENASTSNRLGFVRDAIRRIYGTQCGSGEIRRINVNIAPLTVEAFRELKAEKIGTYQLFQETYHRPTYKRLHVSGPKADYDWRLSAMDRAMTAGIDDVGIGVLFGLHDWRFEVLALMEHAAHLERNFGVGPHTISVPRLEPAEGSTCASNPPAVVSDAAFLKIVAILRLAVPYTGIIMSTRESVAIRRRTFELGVSQISAGSRTNPGGYAAGANEPAAGGQFQLGDHRPVDEVIADIVRMGFVPSFCTACYRMGRTGADFMDLAKPGEIKKHCAPNALSSFQEYLCDFASSETRAAGEQLIRFETAKTGGADGLAAKLVDGVIQGKRDVFV